MFKPTRILAAALGTGAACAVIAIGGTAFGATNSGKRDSGVLYAAITHQSKTTEFLAGNATDKVLGSGAVTYNAKVGTGSSPGTLKITATVTLFSKTGSMSGPASGTLIVAKDGSVTFTNGKIKLGKGAGGQKGHSFAGTFTGSGKSAGGPFVFHYKGIYK
jgi:hypothetical protein